MKIIDAWKQALADKLGMAGRKGHFEPDNRATRRRKERMYRKFEPAPLKIRDDEAKYPLEGYKSPHKPREIASRKPVKHHD